MPRSLRQNPRTTWTVFAVCLCALAGVLLARGGQIARAASTGQLQQQISVGQNRVGALSGAVQKASKQVSRLGTGVAALEGQIASIQSDLDAKRQQLLKLRTELNTARTRLAQLQAYEARAQGILSRQLIGSYEADRPDLVSVVLESTGFNNLLERIAFAQRIRNQDAQIVSQVRTSRREVAAQATRLGALSVRQQRLTVQVLSERNRLDRTRIVLVDQQLAAIRVRTARAGQLSSARGQVDSLRQQLAKLQAAQAAQAARAAQQAAQAQSAPAPAGSGSSGSSSAPTQVPSGGGFTFPLPKSSVSPPGTWSEDDGVDISAPGGTPEYAVCSGTVVLHGIGGFGPSAPVLHCDSPVGGYSYVYYGHAGPGNWVPVGAHVSAGQLISQVGYGIVGISTGPHVEMGFADSSGSPVGPGSAPAMMSLLQSSYAG
jgi:murein DD-endopeptidase MepM/ murein hydrolase activator NlpD